MAGDWLKWVKGLAKKPEVLHMAAQLQRSRHEVAGLLMELWEWADDNAQIEEENSSAIRPQSVRKTSAPCPGIVRTPSASVPLVDGLTGVSGFADAMSSVGWIAFRHGRIEFPNFSRHNGNPAKRRALDAERKQQGRDKERPQNVRSSSAKRPHGKRTREEKRREEKSISGEVSPETPLEEPQAETTDVPPKFDPKAIELPPALDTPRFRTAWVEWCNYRAERKPKLTQLSVSRQLKDFIEWGESAAIEAINLAIRNGWQGVFPPDKKKGFSNAKQSSVPSLRYDPTRDGQSNGDYLAFGEVVQDDPGAA